MWDFFRIRIYLIAILSLLFFPFLTVSAADDSPGASGDVHKNITLSDAFQNKCFSSIESIVAAQNNKKSSGIDDTKKVLFESLYLSYGLKDKAHEAFKDITLDKIHNVSEEILGQEWFYIGKNYFIDGFGEELTNILFTVENSQRLTLDSSYKSKQLNVVSDICLQESQYGNVVKMLELFPKGSIWKNYAIINLGVNLIKNDRVNEGITLLEEIAELPSSNEEFVVLSDQANLALAANYIEMGKLSLSAKYYQKIRLGNPQSSSALLGLGWVKFKMSLYEEALRSWSELAKRSKSDASVHEALMLIPYVLEKTGNKSEALAQYDIAVEIFAQQLKNVEVIKSRIKMGEVVRILRSSLVSEKNYDLPNTIRSMGSGQSDSLYELMVSNDFIEVLNAYHELNELTNNLSKWEQLIPSLEKMTDEEDVPYNYRLATVVNRLKFEYSRKLRDRQAGLVEEIDKLNVNLSEINNDDQKIFELREKYRFLSGLLKWNVNADYNPRIRAVKNVSDSKSIQKGVLQDVHQPMDPFMFAWKDSPAEYRKFTGEIKDKKERIRILNVKIDALMSAYEERAALMAERSIDQYRENIKKYHDRALYGKARLYDLMVRRN